MTTQLRDCGRNTSFACLSLCNLKKRCVGHTPLKNCPTKEWHPLATLQKHEACRTTDTCSRYPREENFTLPRPIFSTFQLCVESFEAASLKRLDVVFLRFRKLAFGSARSGRSDSFESLKLMDETRSFCSSSLDLPLVDLLCSLSLERLLAPWDLSFELGP